MKIRSRKRAMMPYVHSATLLVALASLAVGLLLAMPAEATTTTGRSLLSRLTVRTETGSASYTRTAFPQWVDADHDSCDTRSEVLIAESTRRVRRGAGCRITGGRWVSWYDGRTWTRPSDVDIDHLVPLKEAWESGARAWSTATRRAFANDLGLGATLNAITDNLNSSKQDRDPAQWMPPRAGCKYAQQYVAVKYRWSLSVDAREQAKLSSVLSGTCGARRLALPIRARDAAGTTPTPSITTGTLPPTYNPTPAPTITASVPVPTPPPPYTPTPIAQPTTYVVTPGAFCADHYAYGYTSAGTLMQCVTTPTDSRFRWRAA